MASVVVAITNPETGSTRIKVFDGAEDAQGYIELLLAGGMETRLIRVFTGEEVVFSVQAKPVVTLGTTPALAQAIEEVPAERPASAPTPTLPIEEIPAEPPASAPPLASPDGTRERLPYHRDGERFSSLFKTD